MIDVHKLRSKKNNIIASAGVGVVLLLLAYMAWNAWKPSRTLTWSDRVEAYAFARDFYEKNPGREGTPAQLANYIDECHTKACVVLPYRPGEDASMRGTERDIANNIFSKRIHIETPPEPPKTGLFSFGRLF